MSIMAIGANPKQIAKTIKKVMKQNPVIAISVSEAAPEVVKKNGDFSKKKIQAIVEDQFVKAGRTKAADKVITQKDVINTAHRYDITLKKFLVDELSPDNITYKLEENGHNSKPLRYTKVFLFKEDWYDWLENDEIPFLKSKIKKTSGMLKNAFEQRLKVAKGIIESK